ncbi:putative membrane protein [Lachnospiraceae bacterium XBD2001]|nr:putative membrane protein [Lachnospiraceae bacterium XBD2001]
MKMKKLAICGLCGALAVSSFVGCNTVTATTDKQATVALADAKENDVKTTDELSKHVSVKKSNSNTDSKDETVYVFCDATGKTKKTLVSEELHNASGADEIVDETQLKDIVNLTGDEEYVKNSDGSITWKANGADITYQGTTDAKAPVDMKVTYYLDGKEIKPEDLAGKSGKVKIRFDYTNNVKDTITVNGTKKTTAVPFTVITGMDLDKEKFKNVQVENGTVTEGANGNMVIGLTMPGLKDSLELSFGGEELDLDLPEYFEVTADVTDFELDSIMTMISSGLSSNLSVDGLDFDVDGQMGELQDASTALVDGAGQLADGTKQLYDNIPALTDGVNKLDKGANDLKDGANKLDGGVGQLQNSVNNQLVPGVNQLKDGSAQLAAGMDTLASTLGNMSGAIATAKAGVVATVNTNLQGTGITYETLQPTITELEAKRDAAVKELAGISDDACVQAYAEQRGVSAETIPADQRPTICAGVRQKYVDGIKDANTQIAQLYAAKYQADGALQALDGVGAQLGGGNSEGLSALVQGAHQLDAGLGELQTGMGQLSNGVNQLKGGSSQLAAGTTTLKNGTGEFQSKTKTLVDGASALNDGANKLREGMTQFDEEGISKIVDMVDVDAKDVVETIKGIAELGENYDSFAGKDDDREGSCVFIYKLDGISAE